MIRKHPWFLKKLPRELADGEKLNYGDKDSEQPAQAVEEIMRIIQEAKILAQGSEAGKQSVSGLGDDDDLDADVDAEYIDDSGDFSAPI